MKKSRFIQTFITYWYVFVPYVLVGCVLIHFLRYYSDAIDILNYITISEKYLHGHFYDAINDYWSPMIPWLLTPFLFFKVDPFRAFHILQLIIGVFTLKICIDLIEPVKIKVWMKQVLRFSLIPLILSYGQLFGTPDLLFLTILLFYIRSLIKESYLTNPRYGFKTGLLAGILFLTKAYGFPFICVHFVAINFIYWFKNRNNSYKKVIVSNFVRGLSLFLLISGVWIAMMSYKNQDFTISGSGKYNFSLLGPEYSYKPDCFFCHPAYKDGLFNPANETAVNITESPALFHMHTWNPLASKSNFDCWMISIKNNIKSIYYFDFQRQIGILLLITLLIFIVAGFKLKALPFQAFTLLVTWLIYDLGYVLVIMNHRYVWVNTIIIILLFGWLIEKLCFKNRKLYVLSSVLFFAFIVLLVKRPVKELFYLTDKDTSVSELRNLILHPDVTIERSSEPFKHLFQLIDTLKTHPEFKGRIANHQRKASEDYMNTAIISYYLGNKHYGELTGSIIQKEGYKQLADFKINYYYSWEKLNGDTMTFVMPPVFADTISGFYIYKVLKK